MSRTPLACLREKGNEFTKAGACRNRYLETSWSTIALMASSCAPDFVA